MTWINKLIPSERPRKVGALERQLRRTLKSGALVIDMADLPIKVKSLRSAANKVASTLGAKAHVIEESTETGARVRVWLEQNGKPRPEKKETARMGEPLPFGDEPATPDLPEAPG